MLVLTCRECKSTDLTVETMHDIYCNNCGSNSESDKFDLEEFQPEKIINEVKVVEYQGSVSPIYEEVGSIEVFKSTLGWNGVDEEYCVDLEDLLEFIKYR